MLYAVPSYSARTLMSFTPGRGHEALRRNRWSSLGAEYFLTVCTENRAVGLATPRLATAILGQANQLTADGDWHLRTMTIMPDHMHLLIALTGNSNLAFVMRRFKGRIVPHLRAAGLRWQRGYFDHRMRPDEDRFPVFMYILLNPQRAELIAPHEKWLWYRCVTEDWQWFEPLTTTDWSFPDWLP